MIQRLRRFVGVGSASSHINRARRLLTLSLLSFVILIALSTIMGIFVHREIMITYAENYNALSDAGFSQLITSPTIINDRIMLLISLFPLIGAVTIFPLLIMGIKEIIKIKEDVDIIYDNYSSTDFEDRYVTRSVKIAQSGGH